MNQCHQIGVSGRFSMLFGRNDPVFYNISGVITARRMMLSRSSFCLLLNHQIEPLRTEKPLSSPFSKREAILPRVGWCPTTSIVPSASGQAIVLSTLCGVALVPTCSLVSKWWVSAETVCCVRVAGLTMMRVSFGNLGSSQRAIFCACFKPFSVSLRVASGMPSSASA